MNNALTQLVKHASSAVSCQVETKYHMVLYVCMVDYKDMVQRRNASIYIIILIKLITIVLYKAFSKMTRFLLAGVALVLLLAPL